MDRHEYELWEDVVERMIGKLMVLEEAVHRGVGCREPSIAIENEELRRLDLWGLDLLQACLPTPRGLFERWHVHQQDECTSIISSIARLRANRETFRLIIRVYLGR